MFDFIKGGRPGDTPDSAPRAPGGFVPTIRNLDTGEILTIFEVDDILTAPPPVLEQSQVEPL
jgi:hypothetical protein